ncbi:MAG: chromate transporter [Patescibacteria group bacterium]|nr:chromate transporter [Patescibacteria group bacterium]
MTPAEGREGTLRELAGFFTRLGLTAFGGPAAHIAMMEQEAVRKRAWLTHEGFLDLLGACNLIPGPSSTQMAMSIGYQRAGVVGLVVGGFCFILPAVGLTLLIAWVYVHYGTLPQVQGLLYGVKPVVLAIVFHALWSLGKKAFRTRKLAALGLLALAASLVGLHPLLVLMGAGVFALRHPILVLMSQLQENQALQTVQPQFGMSNCRMRAHPALRAAASSPITWVSPNDTGFTPTFSNAHMASSNAARDWSGFGGT